MGTNQQTRQKAALISVVLSDTQFNEAYQKYSRSTYVRVYRIVNNEAVAEEILQETFLRFLEKADSGRPGDFRTFLIHISHNLAVDYIKKNARVKNVEDFPAEADRRDFAGEAEARVMREDILARLAAVDERYLSIFLLRVDYEMTYDEISTTLGIPKRTMMRHVENLKKLIQDFL